MVGDRLKRLERNDPRGWPRCVRCAKPVEWVTEVWDAEGHGFVAFCHGEAEIVKCGELEPEALDGPAFVPPRMLAP